ncbi:MAG: putative DNA binding domain-containing protein [Bryobacterales bacterium]|nr:putative DNA binding domain-containing protein [Bryobacterales bacterium]
MTINELEAFVRLGESDSVEFKKSTGQLTRAAEALCAFLNGHGGLVLMGVSPDKKIIGQIVADGTLRDIAQCFKRFEPPAPIQIHRVPLPDSDREVLVLQADASYEARPFAFDGRSYERVGSTTSVMPQETYQRLLLERAHAKQRWENLPAAVTLEDLDQDEILRTLKLGAAAGRMPASVPPDAADVLDRLGLRVREHVLNAAVVVFGLRMLPDYPQCQLRMARFRGNDKTEFLDQRQLHGHALQLLEDAMQFLTRHLPVAGRIEPGVFERADAPLFPPIALREA